MKNYKEFVYTKDEYGEVTEDSPLIGVDCEMCMTTGGSQLSYVALIREDLEILYKSFVLTDDPVTNYLTQYSGVYMHDLSSLTTTLADVQKAIREILPKDCILVGHGLNGDLKALRMIHPYVIDTSICYNLTGQLRSKSKLKLLSRVFLNQEIQRDDVEGHCPEEDARATLELAIAKLHNGRAYGDVRYCQEAKDLILPSERVFTKANYVECDAQSVTITSLASKHGKSVTFNMDKTVEELYSGIKELKLYATKFQSGNVESKSKRNILQSDLVVSHCDIRNESTKEKGKVKKLKKKMNKQLKAANEICANIYNGLPARSLFVVICPGNADVNGVAAFKYKN